MGARQCSPSTSLAAAAPILLLAAGCGGLTTPDLSTGEITGRLANVADASAAQVYVVGHPETLAPVASDGSYTLRKVPVGDQRVVFFDGVARAGVVAGPRVEPARRAALQADAAALPLAARVYVVARGSGGTSCDGAAIRVEQSVVQGRVKYGGGPVELWPVPPGDWLVRADLKGFKPKEVALSLGEGAKAPLELTIDDPDDSPASGCKSVSCSDGLKCDTTDGGCYECTRDVDCGNGNLCLAHTCVPASGARDTCEACSADADCGAGGACLGLSGGALGVCATSPASSGGACRSGYASGAIAAAASVCAPPRALAGAPPIDACARLLATFGAPCLSDAACQQDLAGGTCQKPAGATALTVGVCTAACRGDSDCPAHVAFGKCSAGFCARN